MQLCLLSAAAGGAYLLILFGLCFGGVAAARRYALRRREAALQGSEIAFLPGEGRLVRYRRGEPGPGQLEVCLNAGRQPEAVGPGGADLFALAWDGETLAPGGILICTADGDDKEK